MLNARLGLFSLRSNLTQTASKSLVLILVALLLASACGKRKPPVPPKERVLQRVEITGYQRGNQVLVSWKMPARNAPKGSVLNISRADIYRLAEPAGSPLVLSEEEFANRSTLIAAMEISDTDFGLKTLNYRDTLQFANQPARLRYAVRFVNASGQKAAFSNALLIEPTSKVASNPTALAAKSSQEAIILNWTAPATNVDGGTPVSILGYSVYRSTSPTEPAKLLTPAPISETEYRDEFFDFDKEYYYFVRAVSVGLQSEPIESSESNILKFKAVDVFAPGAPTAITLAAAPGTISIFFAVNPEKDVAGYKIYRSDDPNQPQSDWLTLTPELLQTNTFQDSRVESGKTYYYFLTATDSRGNVSKMSEIVSETVP